MALALPTAAESPQDTPKDTVVRHLQVHIETEWVNSHNLSSKVVRKRAGPLVCDQDRISIGPPESRA